MAGELLWVYEGLTQFLGKVLPYRAGIWNAEDFRESLAMTAGRLALQGGRTWRPLRDTAVEAQILYNASDEWQAYRRGTDFYEEGVLLWLDVDMTLRTKSGGKKSIDDFTRAFYGGDSGKPALRTYTFDDVVATLNSIVPMDWSAFLNQRLNSLAADAPLGGIENAGYKLIYDETPNVVVKRDEDRNDQLNLISSIGLLTKKDGTIIDVIPGSAAAKAGVTPGSKILAVNGRGFTREMMRSAVRASKETPGVELILTNGDFYTTTKLDYRGGLRYPHLERVSAKSEYLEELGKSKR
jgi:predicted metalloprotease with PDZ domain